MKLTEIELAALERYRVRIHSLIVTQIQWEQRRQDAHKLADAMLRLYPPGHDAEITPECLIACGGMSEGRHHFWSVASVPKLRCWWCDDGGLNWCTMNFSEGSAMYIPQLFRPRNMAEVWQLLERCGIPVTKGGE